MKYLHNFGQNTEKFPGQYSAPLSRAETIYLDFKFERLRSIIMNESFSRYQKL